MSHHDPVDLTGCTRFGPAPAAPVHRPRWKLTRGVGYFTLFIIAAALLTANNGLLRAMAKNVSAQQRAAEEAKQPAAIQIIAIISPKCATCYNVGGLISNLGANQRVKITNPRTIDINSSEGVALVNQYKLTRSPAFIITGQSSKALAAIPDLKSFGQVQNDVFVGSNIPAPYMDLVAGKLRGEFTATYVTEKSCQECYDPTINRQALAQLGMKPVTEKVVDSRDKDGRELVKKYSLTTTPTIILTGDLAAYSGFDAIWRNDVGTIEPDGAYVFRSAQDRMGTYYDLTKKKAVTPLQANVNTDPGTPKP